MRIRIQIAYWIRILYTDPDQAGEIELPTGIENSYFMLMFNDFHIIFYNATIDKFHVK